jgi:peptidoglycan/xylan/chitin deacetylase (PgdA/CDA1 family)
MMWAFLGGAALAVAVWGFLRRYARGVPKSQISGPVLVYGPPDGRRVTLTFDDGPVAPYTEQILDILRERKIAASFFVCGKNVERYPEIIRRICAEGHTLGNHTYTHPFLYFRSRANMAAEIDRTQKAIEKITGFAPKLFRPPYGARWVGLYRVLTDRGMTMVQWSDDGCDWKYGSDAIVRATLKGLRPGSIILLHDGHEVRQSSDVDRSHTVKALPVIIDGAIKAGFNFVPIGEFVNSKFLR